MTMVTQYARRVAFALTVLLVGAGCTPTASPGMVPTPPRATASPVATVRPTAPPFNTNVPVPTATVKSSCKSVGGLPDARCTPGKTNPDVTPATEGTTICQTGWTATVRPPTTITDRLKRERMHAYGYDGLPASDVELDHLVALEMGGHPDDIANLWPQKWADEPGAPGAHTKDQVENVAHRHVCAGTITLQFAQASIALDWVSFGRALGVVP